MKLLTYIGLMLIGELMASFLSNYKSYNRTIVQICGFLPFTQKIFRQPISEIFYFSQLFIADAPMKKKKIQKCSFTPRRALLGHLAEMFQFFLL